MPETEVRKNEIETALEAGIRLAHEARKVIEQNGIPYLLIPNDMRLERLESLSRIETRHTVSSVGSFMEYLERYKQPSTVIFSDESRLQLTGIVDYHDPGDAKWGLHRITLQLQRSPEWETWTGRNKRAMTQVEFAEFLEDNIADVAAPDASTLQDAILKIQIVRLQTTKAVRNLATNETQLAYTDEETQSEGTVNIPRELTLGLRPYKGADLVRFTARLRYKPVNGGGVTFTYLINRLEEISEKAFGAVCDEIAATTELPVLLGVPG